MRGEEQIRRLPAGGIVVAAPSGLGFRDCVALFLSAVLLTVSILSPRLRG